MELNELTFTIRGSVFEVNRIPGSGFVRVRLPPVSVWVCG